MTLWDSLDANSTDEPNETTWSVAELGTAIGSSLKATFPTEVWLRGEIRSLRAPNRTGHQYFDLIEPGAEPGAYPDAKLSVSLFRNTRSRITDVLRAAGSAELADGIEVRIRGRVDWWSAGGQLRVVMSDIDPTFTLGQLDAQRRALLAQLVADGLLDANAQLPLPLVPLRIGLVTSAGSAAHADFVDELRASRYAFDVVLADARVQGADATRTITAAITKLAGAGVDVIAVVRGGGSRTDLVAFDHHDVAYAIARATVPVFTGIGHEIDRSVADEVAHRAFKTPTATAGALIARVAESEAALDHAARRLAQLGNRHLRAADVQLESRERRVAHAAHIAESRASAHLQGLGTRLDLISRRRLHDEGRNLARRIERLSIGAPHQISRAIERLENRSVRLGASDPTRLLARGWSLTRTIDGTLVRDVSKVAPGTELVTTVANGTLSSSVTAISLDQERS